MDLGDIVALHLYLVSVLMTLVVAYVIHGQLYPRITGKLKTAGQTWRYRRGRIPFFTAGKVYLWAYRSWNVVKDPVKLTSCDADWKVEHKSYWQHVCDCGLLYPATSVYIWVALRYWVFI